MTDRIVVVGGGLGGLRTVEAVRRLDPDRPILLISEERLHPYDRPPLSKHLFDPKRLAAPPFLRAPDAYGGLCDVLLGQRAVSLDPAAHAVTLADGTDVAYSALVLATGARPRRLPVLTGRTVRDYADAVALRDDVLRHGCLTVVGAGFLGCELASAAATAGARVVLVEAAPAPLCGAVGPVVGAHVRGMLEAGGVDVRCGTGVAGVGTRRLTLLDGSEVDGSVVAVCVGAEPDVGWLASAGLVVDNGVVCDGSGATSARDVYAVGDVAAWHYPGRPAPVRVEHWTTTGMQAMAVAGAVVTGRDEPLDPLHYFWSDQCATKLQCFGLPSPDDDVESVRGGDGTSLLAVYGSGGTVSAVLGVGRPRELLGLRRRLADGASFAELAATAREEWQHR
jgi:NADPH-dependent 2,4-dienoyl-CoA reductase/sulfur reductase-like enzyme